MTDCKAKRCNDEMHCGKCGLVWDIKDPEPPRCKPERHATRGLAYGRSHLQKIREMLK